jgi:hypothetical protein
MRGIPDDKIDPALSFMQAGGAASRGQMLVNGNMPPFLAHVQARKLNPAQLADDMSWEEWCAAVPGGWLSPDDLFMQMLSGEIEPTCEFAVRFYYATGITPDACVPQDHPYPAHPAFVEAGVYLLSRRVCSDDEAARVRDFLSDEVDKAHELGAEALAPNPATNETILHTIETFYECQIEKDVQMGLMSEEHYHRAMNDDLPEIMRAKWGAAIEVCAERLERIVKRLSQAKDTVSQNHFLDAITKRENFRLWRDDPGTELFLQACANMLHIVSRIPVEDLSVSGLQKAEIRHSNMAPRP